VATDVIKPAKQIADANSFLSAPNSKFLSVNDYVKKIFIYTCVQLMRTLFPSKQLSSGLLLAI
jgi:hypothetical protein